MLSVLRFGAALVLASLCIPFTGWFTLVCADFIGLDDCICPNPGWIMFAVVSSLSLSLPPALHAWPDLSRPHRELIRESLRAVLLAFALFAVSFLAGAKPLFDWVNVPAPMSGMVAANLSLTFSCPLAFISYSIARSLLPTDAPEKNVPPAIRHFGRLSFAFLTLLALQPWLSDNDALLFPSKLSLLCAAWIIVALRMAIREHGEAGFVPAWGTFCLLLVFRIGQAAPVASGADLALSAILFFLAVWSCACLLRRESRLWLMRISD